jgi:hypothetical protein
MSASFLAAKMTQIEWGCPWLEGPLIVVGSGQLAISRKVAANQLHQLPAGLRILSKMQSRTLACSESIHDLLNFNHGI